MKKYLFFLIISFLIVGCSSTNNANNSNSQNSNIGPSSVNTTLDTQVESMEKEELSTDEKTSLEFIREEEKLARDVYSYLYDLYGTKIFNNITTSEISHMTSVKVLLDKYEITDPIEDDTKGIFVNTHLQEYYDILISQGSTELIEAIKVGLTIEDLDIRDIQKDIDENIDNEDIKLVYESLLKGSRNHMRAFYKQLANNGGTYTPQFITQELYEEIINSDMETGN